MIASAHAADSAGARESFTAVLAGETITVSIGVIDGVKVNGHCLQNPDACQALKVFKGPSRVSELRSHPDTRPSTAYCRFLNGTPLYLDSTQREGVSVPFCVFKDLSMIDTDALYRKHFDSSHGEKK